MKQLPGLRNRTLTRWLKNIMAGTITVIATIWQLSLLPFLLLVALILSIALIPLARRLRRDMERADFSVDEFLKTDRRRDINVTPWHRQLCNAWKEFSS